MGKDVNLVIVDKETGLVMVDEWVGGNKTADAILDVRKKPTPEFETRSHDAWLVSPSQARKICEEHYSGGLEPEEVDKFRAKYPMGRYVWQMIVS